MRADDDTVLARRAAAGDGAAFATLYDRHERRAYNLCYRITGSADDAADATQETFLRVLERLPSLEDRELNFGSYLLTAARHASYDAIKRRRRASPTGEIPDSAVPLAGGEEVDGPERQALRAVHQEQIRIANEGLPPRQREALALRELEELSYDEVASAMGMNRNSVAQLISRARINLRDGLRHGALGAITAATPDCESALPLLALAQDDALDDEARAAWLASHLVGCATCRMRVEAMEEAGAAYRQWLPLVPVLWLRDAAVAHAAERTASRERWSRVRRGGALAAAGMVLIAAAGLVAADFVDAPTHARAAAPATVVTAIVTPAPQPATVVTAIVTPAPQPAVVHRPRRHRAARSVAPPAPVIAAAPQPTPTPTPALTATPAPAPARHVATRTKPKAADAELTPVEPAPVVVDEPPPPPPPDKPPAPVACSKCPIAGGPPPVP
jgi:RNA polymerase sigma factor (sigma-70 family)